MPDVIRVAMVPDYREGNPYQDLLARALRTLGVEVTFPSVGRPRELADIRADILHIHWLPFWFPRNTWKVPRRIREFFRALERMRARGVRVVHTLHNEMDHETLYRPLWVRWVEKRARSTLYARVDGFVFHCGEALWRVPGATSRPAVVYPHPDLAPAYPEGVEKEEARRQLGLPVGMRLLLAIGQIRPYKRLDRWVEVVQGVPGMGLVIAGTCRLPGGCESLRRENVFLHPRALSPEEVSRFLSAADGVLIPQSRMLTSGVAALGMSFGKLLIAPRVGCNPEALNPDAVVWVHPGRPEEERRALEVFVRMGEEELVERGKRGQVWVRRWTFEAFALHHRDLYRRVMGSPGLGT